MRVRIAPITIRPASPGRDIQGVDTSTAALVGAPASGAPKRAVLVTSLVEYEREFGSVDDDLRRAVKLFFDNDGRRAYVLRPQSDVAEELEKLASRGRRRAALPPCEAHWTSRPGSPTPRSPHSRRRVSTRSVGLTSRIVVWGARTLATTEPEWRYVNVCRFALYLERSIVEGTRWAVFEPNGENLWREVRRSVETSTRAVS